MTDITPDLCDENPELVRVLEPMLSNYGGREAFGGEIVTVKCFEDNSLVKEYLGTPGQGKVMVVDGGASLRKALLGDMIAESAVKNGWQGVIIYGCIRDVSTLSTLDLGVQALATVPLKTDKRGIGDYNIPVTFGGVTFIPGEYVYADSNGVVVASKRLTIPE
ncbi:MAG TPA: putative 4-hydroxy-4-methyl-2-oxoglutarate aldolase [Porticoccaceae bacterium]|nr:putative 4-hydroxy-4-methyl-2-oxoglutarate aldolase [Porticoccaceae bacterium]HCO58641.1 putative 4-hydroxy-4-methyl-2-oxoglutarate aldolase [Porticoccaceae bacterium]